MQLVLSVVFLLALVLFAAGLVSLPDRVSAMWQSWMERRQRSSLTRFAFFSGAGLNTAMGMGQVLGEPVG